MKKYMKLPHTNYLPAARLRPIGQLRDQRFDTTHRRGTSPQWAIEVAGFVFLAVALYVAWVMLTA